MHKILQGYADFLDETKAVLAESIDNVDFDETSRLEDWARALDLQGSNDSENLALGKLQVRKDRNLSAYQLQEQLHAAGFVDLYVHESYAEREPYDLSTAALTDKVLSWGATLTSFHFFDDGRRVLVIRNGLIESYALELSYTMSGELVQVGAPFDPDLGDPPVDLVVSNDGTHLIVLLDGGSAASFTMSGNDPDTIVIASAGSFAAVGFTCTHLASNPAGSVILAAASEGEIRSYDLTVAWDVSDKTLTGAATTTAQPQGLDYAPTQAIFVDSTGDVRSIDLSNDQVMPGSESSPITNLPYSVGTFRLGGAGGLGVGVANGTRAFAREGDSIHQISIADYEPRNPFDYTEAALIGTVRCGQSTARCGNENQRCNAFLNNNPGYLVWSNGMPEPPPALPEDSTYWGAIFYIGGETFPDVVELYDYDRERLETLIYKNKPERQWAVMLVDYIETEFDPLFSEEGDELLTEDGELLYA